MQGSRGSAGLGALGRVGQALDQQLEGVDSLVDLAVAAAERARVDALEDDGQLPVAEREVVVQFGEVTAGALGVAGGELLAAGEAGGEVGRFAEPQLLL